MSNKEYSANKFYYPEHEQEDYNSNFQQFFKGKGQANGFFKLPIQVKYAPYNNKPF